MTGKPPVRAALMGTWRREDWLGFGLGLATLAIVGALVLLGLGAAVVGAFLAAPFVCALFARIPATLLIGASALALAAASDAWRAELESDAYWIALGIIALGTVFAAAAAVNRERSRLHGERLRILDAVAMIADGSRPLGEALDRVTELIAPGVADICMIDAIHPGGVTRAAVRAWGHPRAREVESRLRTRPPSLPKWLTAGERLWRQIPRWRPRIKEEELRRMARSDEDFEFLSSLRIRSMLVVPLSAGDRNLGALTLLSAWSGRRYSEDDVRFAQIAARRIGLALENAGLFSDLESVERRMDTVMSILDEAVMIHSRDGKLVFANPAAARTMGFDDRDKLLAIPIGKIGERLEIRDESGRPLGPESLAGGRALNGDAGSLIVRVTDRATRRESWLRVRSQPIEGPEGGLPLYSVTVIEDVTDVKRAEVERARVAEVLQRELLPPALPAMEGWEVATMYRAAGEASEVGGDFYEAFPVGEDWVVILGDVTGHGPLAASLTAAARHTIRTATTLAADPAVGLRVLDERLRERDAVALCSVAVLLLPRTERGEQVEARVWLAGHPPPFVVHDGTPREVGSPGPLVGIGEAPAWRPERVTLHPGDQLVVYTDGVTEARRPDGDRFGTERLRQRLASCDEPSTTVARVESAVDRFSPDEPKDDATLVAIQRVAPPARPPAGGSDAATEAAKLM